MNKEHPNIAILKRLNLQNPEVNTEIIAADFVWHYYNPELPEMEGDYAGLSGLAHFFTQLAKRTKGTFKVAPLSIVPMGDDLVITHVKDRMVLNGNPMEIDAVVVWCIMEGKIREAWDIPVIPTAKAIKTETERV
jgi:predicted SnoaL-like aldol condensation-catalyzing enzyme